MKTRYKISILLVIASMAIVTILISLFSHYDKIDIFCGEANYLQTLFDKCRSGGPITILTEQHTSKIIISVGNPIDSIGLVPIVTTQISTSTQPITKIIDRTYHPTNYGNRQPDEIGTSWELIPDPLRIDMEVVGENNIDVIDRTKASFGRIQPLYETLVTCSDNTTVKILYGAPIIVPIKEGIYGVLDRNSVDGLLPNDNGEYVLDFVSFFKQEIELPDDAIILSSVNDTCSTPIQNHEVAYYDRIVFKLRENEN